MMKVEITVPEEYMGDVIGDINSRRGRMEGMEAIMVPSIRAFIPFSEMFGYATHYVLKHKVEVLTQWNSITMKKFQRHSRRSSW